MANKTRVYIGSALLMFGLAPGSAGAGEDKPAYDRISFSVSAGSEVDNDLVTAVLYARREGPDLAELSGEVNKAIAAAVARARKEPAVTVQTLDYQTYPNYQNGKPAGWQVRQSIRLESKAPEPLAKLIGELQASLALGSLDYSISPDRAREHEDQLIDQALSAFRSRAERVTRDLGRSKYRIVSIQVNTAGQPILRPQMRMAPMAADVAAAAPPPSLEPGKDRMEVEVNGTIELQPN
jgi:predicted secreted protein